MQGKILTVEQRTTEQQKAQAIRAELVHQLIRVGKVAERFTHLAAIVTCHHAGGNDITVGVFVLRTCLAKGTDFCQSNVDSMHIVKPSPHLANVFDNEICRVIRLKLLSVFERIMQLRKRHTTALEPAVQHLIDTGKGLTVNRKGDIIYPRTVVIIQLHAAQFLQLRV